MPLKTSETILKAGNDISSNLLKFSRWVPALIIHRDLTERDVKHKILQLTELKTISQARRYKPQQGI